MTTIEKQSTNFMGSKMTLDDIKDRVPSNVTIQTFEDDINTDVIIDGAYSGWLYDTSEGMYYQTWLRLTNWDDYLRVNSFLKRFKFELLINIRANISEYRIYRLIK